MAEIKEIYRAPALGGSIYITRDTQDGVVALSADLNDVGYWFDADDLRWVANKLHSIADELEAEKCTG